MNLAPYLARIGLAPPLPPTLDTLRRLHVAHLGAFTFHNLEIQRHGSVRVDVESIERAARARLRSDHAPRPRRTAGDARAQPHAPARRRRRPAVARRRRLRRRGAARAAPARRRRACRAGRRLEYLLRRDAHHWTLWLRCGESCEEMYQFADTPHTRGDVEIANYFTSTHPSSIFRRTLTIQRVTPEERVILRPAMITRYRDGVRTETPIEPAQLRRFARELFGIELGEAALLFEKTE